MKRILVIEDDPAILRGLKDNLEEEHFEVATASDGETGYKLAKRQKNDLIILDLVLPFMNGEEMCRKLRAEGVTSPIIMLTSKGAETDKVLGLELGADDYVTKPFSVRELIARVKAVLRRQESVVVELTELTFGDVWVDFRKHEARRGSKPVDLNARELALLKYLAEREGVVVTRAQLLDDVWGFEVTPTTRTVDNYVLSLRKKVEKNPAKPRHLLTVHTAGYKFIR